jgi:hypothetical protein
VGCFITGEKTEMKIVYVSESQLLSLMVSPTDLGSAQAADRLTLFELAALLQHRDAFYCFDSKKAVLQVWLSEPVTVDGVSPLVDTLYGCHNPIAGQPHDAIEGG